MPPNRNAPLTDNAREALVEQIRANTAFEHIAISVLSGSVICGVAAFILRIAVALIGGRFAIDAIFAAFFSGLVLTLLFFLIGFASGAVVISPLFRFLEKQKRRTIGPYAAAVTAIAGASLIVASVLPGAGTPGLVTIVAVLAASGATIVIFTRRMKSIWAAAAAEEKAADARPITFRIQ